MKSFRAIFGRVKASLVIDHLPEVNDFVNVASDGKTESLPIEAIGHTSFEIRCPANATIGANAIFSYRNGRGQFRFLAQCAAINGPLATYTIPDKITIIGQLGDRRQSCRLAHVLPVLWRYAPDGVGYGEYVKSTSINFSSVGLALVVSRELRPGTLTQLKIDMNGSGHPFLVVAALARPTQQQPSGKFLAGLAFQKLSPTNAHEIDDFIEMRQHDDRDRSLARNA